MSFWTCPAPACGCDPSAFTVTALLVVGIKESARVNNVIVFIKVSILVLLIGLGLPMVSSDNWGGPFIPQSDE